MTRPAAPAPARRRGLAACLPLAAMLLPFAACTPPPDAPAFRSPAAVLRLQGMQDQANRGAWGPLAAAEPGDCAGAADAVCAQGQALRARACRMLAAQAEGAAARRPHLDCAVTAGRAALAAAGATPPAERAAWREALAWSLFQRRQIQPRAALCPDNAALRETADALRGTADALRGTADALRGTADALRAGAQAPRAGTDAPRAGGDGPPGARFLAASARLTDAVEGCVPASRRCAGLAEARALLTPAPPGDQAWAALAVATTEESRRLACPSR